MASTSRRPTNSTGVTLSNAEDNLTRILATLALTTGGGEQMSNRLFEEVFRGSATALIIRGIAAVLFGILVLLLPDVPVLALVLLFGVYALIDGVAGTVDWFRRRRRSPWALAGNAISIIAGIVAVLWPGSPPWR